ncbi:metallophosphoesterase [uncultured Ruminococcus sp.]|uniref:metallophosphoesterase family protein n=1 Tax=uncultured Ruminococcus sp. TaxID=165186 RepID=UPI00292F9595|nr:metallophosphoesterase [uncultured Ruminococcus sp.]
MRILAVADKESAALYDYYHPGKLDGFDLILGCGDLSEGYLEFLMTLADCPLVYVHGNHDENHKKVPLGCICADDKVVEVAGLRILGLGGSMKYREGKYMYSERRMRLRILRRKFSIMRHGGIDVLLTHAPARGLNDLEDLPHRGFKCFHKLLKKYKPALFVHGHVHREYNHNIPQRTIHNGTLVVNAFGYAVIEI